MAMQPLEAGEVGEFQLGFGSNMGFQTASEILSQPDSRKRVVQTEKDETGVEDTFIQPDPPKKHKASHSTQDLTMEPSSDHLAAHVHQRGGNGSTGHFMQHESHESSRFDGKTSLETVLRELGQDMKMMYLKWAQPLGEGESFEAFCPARLDELLREAQRLEQHLKSQKERLRERLTLLTRTLQIPVR